MARNVMFKLSVFLSMLMMAMGSMPHHGIDPKGPLTRRAEFFRAMNAPSDARSLISSSGVITNQYAVVIDAGSTGSRVYVSAG